MNVETIVRPYLKSLKVVKPLNILQVSFRKERYNSIIDNFAMGRCFTRDLTLLTAIEAEQRGMSTRRQRPSASSDCDDRPVIVRLPGQACRGQTALSPLIGV